MSKRALAFLSLSLLTLAACGAPVDAPVDESIPTDEPVVQEEVTSDDVLVEEELPTEVVDDSLPTEDTEVAPEITE